MSDADTVNLGTISRDLLVCLTLLWDKSIHREISWTAWLNSIAEIEGNRVRYYLCTMMRSEHVQVDPFYWEYSHVAL